MPRSGRLLLYADLLSPRLTERAIARLGLSGRRADDGCTGVR